MRDSPVKADSAIYTAFDDYTHRDPAESERNLMRAILRGALEDIRKRGEPYRDARRYLMAREEAYLFSFESVCQHLNLCPKSIRFVLGLINDHRLQQSIEASPSE